MKYQIQTTVPDSVSDGVRHIVANTSYITLFLQNMDKWMSQNGVVDVTLPNGQTVSLQSIRALQAAMLDKHKNGADIPNKQAFVKNLGAQPAGNYASATVERLSEGVYLIKNVLEFNADAAWGGVDGGVEILTVTRLIFQMVDLFLSVSRCRKIRCGM
ncbi:hypothetical protein [Xenorhabdus eapokensis]|nr:hypothetical protein [Xenorhabdus eapokensis]